MILPFIVIFIFLVFICFANLKSSVENVKLLEKLLFVPIATTYSLLIKWNYINFTNALILALLIMNLIYFCSPFIQYQKDKHNPKTIHNLINSGTFIITFSIILLLILFYCKLGCPFKQRRRSLVYHILLCIWFEGKHKRFPSFFFIKLLIINNIKYIPEYG